MSQPSANEDFAASLLTFRTDRNLSREDLAKKASISRNTLYLIEEVKTNVRLLTMCRLATALKIHPCQFFSSARNGCLAPTRYAGSNLPAIVARNIKQLREQRGLSQNELTKLAQLPRGYISEIERSQPDLTLDVLSRIAAALDVPVHLPVIHNANRYLPADESDGTQRE